MFGFSYTYKSVRQYFCEVPKKKVFKNVFFLNYYYLVLFSLMQDADWKFAFFITFSNNFVKAS